MGRRVAPDALFLILHVEIFVVWFPPVLTARSIVGKGRTKRILEDRLEGEAHRNGCAIRYTGFSVTPSNFLLPCRAKIRDEGEHMCCRLPTLRAITPTIGAHHEC